MLGRRETRIIVLWHGQESTITPLLLLIREPIWHSNGCSLSSLSLTHQLPVAALIPGVPHLQVHTIQLSSFHGSLAFSHSPCRTHRKVTWLWGGPHVLWKDWTAFLVSWRCLLLSSRMHSLQQTQVTSLPVKNAQGYKTKQKQKQSTVRGNYTQLPIRLLATNGKVKTI